jgi:hypothetical protein
VDALEAERLRSFRASRLPSKPGAWVAWVGKAGTMSFRAGRLGVWWRLVVELFDVLGLAKSTVLARWEPRVGGGSGRPPMRWTSTQSGSGLGVKGLLGRLGLGM